MSGISQVKPEKAAASGHWASVRGEMASAQGESSSHKQSARVAFSDRGGNLNLEVEAGPFSHRKKA